MMRINVVACTSTAPFRIVYSSTTYHVQSAHIAQELSPPTGAYLFLISCSSPFTDRGSDRDSTS